MGGKKHGQSSSKNQKKTRTYSCWNSMKGRCLNPKDKDYLRYGGRGVTVCERWKNFEHFFLDMGVCPPGHEIDRINPDGNYEPDNCRWVTESLQANNRRNTIWLEYLGVSYPLSILADMLGIPAGSIRHELRAGRGIYEIVERRNGPNFGKKDRFRGDNSRASKFNSSTIMAMKAEYDSVPNSGSRKPRGVVQALANKYGMTRDYANKVLRGRTNWTK